MKEKKYDKFKSRFTRNLFWGILGVLLLTSGINVGMIVLIQEISGSGIQTGGPGILYTIITLIYWFLASFFIVWKIRDKMYKIYEIPLMKISKTINMVACGDFKVRVDSINPPEKQDYLDNMAKDLNHMIEELNGIETLRTDFISVVSHELKTPLAIIQNYARMLQESDLSEEERLRYVNAVSATCERLTFLVSNILKLNKLENQHIFTKVMPYDLGEAIRMSILGFETVWCDKNINLEIDIDDGIITDTDNELLSLVWNNFISNAIKFTPEGGKIHVSLKKTEGKTGKSPLIEFAVSDCGPGMDDFTRKHVFEKFFQGDNTNSSQGNGLGLALAARVATICNARIGVQSELGKGSRFFFQFSS